MNVSFYFDYYKDWNKQLELVSVINNNIQKYSNKIVFIKDYTDNALERTYRSYECNGLFDWKIKNNNTIAFDIS